MTYEQRPSAEGGRRFVPWPPALLPLLALGAALATQDLAAQAAAGGSSEGNAVLSAAEQEAGWRLLFDGQTLQGWRSLKSAGPPPGWKAMNGELIRESSGGDLLTAEQFGDFELVLEWRIAAAGNSGIMFRVTTDHEQAWETGPEMQVLDNARHRDGRDPLTSAGANYALHAPAHDATRPPGEWNEVRLRVRGAHVEHWLNGEKVVEYALWSPDWEARVAASKFASLPAYGRATRGHIALQDHGDFVAYRHIKVRPL